MAENINIAGRLHSTATGNVVAGADEILDDSKGKKQSEINTETYSLVNEVNAKLDSLNPEQQGALDVAAKANKNEANLGYYVCSTEENVAAKVISDATGYVLSKGGSMKVKMTNANTAANATLNINSTGAKPLYYDGERVSTKNSWEAGATIEVYYDGTSFYANNVAGGSGSGDGVFDVSVKYPTSGVEGGNTYTLEGALAVLNANLHAGKKKGGMSIKFVQSSDNKYVQYRLMAQGWSPVVTDWQGVDDEPTAGSDNLVKSGGVANVILDSIPNGTIKASLIKRYTSIDFHAEAGDTVNISFTGVNTNGIRFIATDDSIAAEFTGSTNRKYIFAKDVKFALVVYGDITDVDIQLEKVSNSKLLISGTYFNGGLKRAEQHICNINAGSTVYVHLEGQAGTGLNFIYDDNSNGYVSIPQSSSSIDTSVTLDKSVIKIQAAFGDLSVCVLASKGKDWTPTIAQIQSEIDALDEYKEVEELGKQASISENTLERGVIYPFFAKAGDKISYQFTGTSGAALQFRKGDDIVQSIAIQNGETQLSGDVTAKSDIDSVNAAFGDLTDVVIAKSESYNPYYEINKLNLSDRNADSVLPSGNNSILDLKYSDFEHGNININGEADDQTPSCIRLKDYRRVVQNTNVTVSVGSGYGIRLFFWDNTFKFISRSDMVDGTTGTITIPDKAGFVKIVINSLSSQSIFPSVFDTTNTVVTLLNSPKYVPSSPLYCSELNRRVYVGSLVRAVAIPFYAKAGDKIYLNFTASTGVGVSLKNNDNIILQKQVASGGTSYEGIVEVDTNINNINAAYGDVSHIEIYSEDAELYSLPINAPAIQKPANSDSDSDFNAEEITIEQLYGAFDSIISKMPGGSNSFSFEGRFPKYMTKHNIEGNVTPCPDPQTENEITASALKIRTYVLTRRNRYAWIYNYPRYAWKNPVSGTVAYTNSCTPRAGDGLYPSKTGTSVGWAIDSYSPSTGITTTGNVNFKRHASSDYKGDIIFTKDISGGDLSVFDASDNSLGTSTYVDLTHRSFNSKSYERIESLDYHTDNKATIFLWANEHGPQSDPYEGSIISYRLARDLCYAVDNPFLNYLRNYCKVIIIPCANPYSMDMWAAEQRHGRNNANGVNINRNYDTPGWEIVADSDKGSAAGSENETQYIMNTIKLFNPDVAVDIHVLGYTSLGAGGSEGKCHYEGHIPSISFVNKIDEVMLMYGLKLSSYGDATPDTNAKGSDWLYYNNIVGGLIEMNAGEASATYNGNQHTSMMMQADYTLLLNTIWMWYKENDSTFILRSGGFV